jgi:hypothetical protein
VDEHGREYCTIDIGVDGNLEGTLTVGERCKSKPIETRVESAWHQRSKLKYDESVSEFAFKFKLRRYMTVELFTDIAPMTCANFKAFITG